VDEVTGLSRHVVADSPDEKRQPAIVIKGKTSKRYLMPSRAHLMVQDGETAHRATFWPNPARDYQDERHHGWSAPRGRTVRARKPHETAVISEIDAR